MVWYSHLFQNFPEFIVVHSVKGFGIVNKAEIDAFLELSCFFHDPADVGNLISDSSDFSKSNLYIWKFSVHNVFHVHLSPVPWACFLPCLVSSSPHLPRSPPHRTLLASPLPAPRGGGGQRTMPGCRALGRELAPGTLLSTGSDLPLSLVGSSPSSLLL